MSRPSGSNGRLFFFFFPSFGSENDILHKPFAPRAFMLETQYFAFRALFFLCVLLDDIIFALSKI